MTMRRVINKKCDSLYLLPFSLFVGFLLFLQVWPSTHVLAASKDQPPVQTSVLRSGVSVVRLVVSYRTGTSTNLPPMQCTGLGVVIASNPTSTGNTNSSTGSYKNWILTDGSLVDTDADSTPPCFSTSQKATLSGITVYMSNGNSGYSTGALQQTTGDITTAHCLPLHTSCSKNIAVFSLAVAADASTDFSSQPLPAISSASNTQVSPSINVSEQQAIALTTSQNILPDASLTSHSDAATDPQYDTTLQSYLVPNEFTVPDANGASADNSASSTPTAATNSATPTAVTSVNLESGTPFVDSNGYFSDMQLKDTKPIPYSVIAKFITSSSLGIFPSNSTASTNPVQSNWQNGITAYGQHNFTQAQTDFQHAFDANRSFLRAQQMAAQSMQMTNSVGTGQAVRSHG